jgi:hypothetical protein
MSTLSEFPGNKFHTLGDGMGNFSTPRPCWSVASEQRVIESEYVVQYYFAMYQGRVGVG